MSSAPRYNPHYTIADYEQWEGDWELWNGVAISMTPSPSFEHQRLATRLTFLLESELRKQSSCGCLVVHETDWRITDDLVVRPDVCVVCEPVEQPYITNPPTLVAEVLSPSTREKDTGSKADLYARHGVRHYLLIDPSDLTCDVFLLVGDRYEPAGQQTDSELELKLHEGCMIKIEINDLLNRA